MDMTGAHEFVACCSTEERQAGLTKLGLMARPHPSYGRSPYVLLLGADGVQAMRPRTRLQARAYIGPTAAPAVLGKGSPKRSSPPAATAAEPAEPPRKRRVTVLHLAQAIATAPATNAQHLPEVLEAMLQATPQSPLHDAALAALSEAAVAAPVELLAAMLGSKQTLRHMMQVCTGGAALVTGWAG
jgi:hypothetical protein